MTIEAGHNAKGRYTANAAQVKQAHPVGATRYHGQQTRGEAWTRCKVIGHTTTGKVWLERECNGSKFTVIHWGAHVSHSEC